MDEQQAEAALALAVSSEEDGAVQCPFWRQVQEEARSMVSVDGSTHVWGCRVVPAGRTCDACVQQLFFRRASRRARASHEQGRPARHVHVCQRTSAWLLQ